MPVLLAAFAVRFFIVLAMVFTDAIFRFRLSPDSERYHREGVKIAESMARGDFNWPNWIDNGWFQITGFVYWVVGPSPFAIQLLNITMSTTTVYIVFRLAKLSFPAMPKVPKIAAIGAAFFPSLIYWSCMMLKDPFAILCICLVVYSAVMIRRELTAESLILLAAGLCGLMMVRTYLLVVMGVLFFAALLPIGKREIGTSVGRIVIVLIITGVATSFTEFGPFGVDYYREAIYFDLDYINRVRVAMGDHGNGAFYSNADDITQFGASITDDITAALKGIFYFFVTIDITNLGSARQMMAIPEFLIMLIAVPLLVAGIWKSWNEQRNGLWPLLVFIVGIMAVYVSATTNMGAMFRWRTQVMPFVLILAAYSYVRLFSHGHMGRSLTIQRRSRRGRLK